MLPSVASLRALRLFARKADATKAMIGFGDPIFDPTERAVAMAERRTRKARAAMNTRASSAEFHPHSARARVMPETRLPLRLR